MSQSMYTLIEEKISNSRAPKQRGHSPKKGKDLLKDTVKK